MTEQNSPQNESAHDAASVTQRFFGQYVRDVSFENAVVQKGLLADAQQQISVQASVDSHRRGGDNKFEVIIKLRITSKSSSTGDTMFLLEIEYAGLFEVLGLNDEQLRTHLSVECPRMMFPFLRRIVAELTQDGGFAPLILNTIDFVSIYRKAQVRDSRAG